MMNGLTLHTPIDRTPRHLSRSIEQLAVRTSIGSESMVSLDILLAVLARALHRSVNDPLKEQHMWRHAVASNPEGL